MNIPTVPQTKKPPSRKGVAWFFKTIFVLLLAGSVLGVALVGFVFWQFSRGLPKIISPSDYRPLIVSQIIATGGKEPVVIGEFFKEKRYLVPFEQIPKGVINAFIAAEDDRFFAHQGINLASMLRAGIANFRAGHVVQGGSTITQQVAKSLLLTPERSWDRKIKEIILAARIEKNLTKQQILYLYLNQIYLGNGAYGVQAASKVYFGKDVGVINFAEAALLAGMPQAPGKYSPLLNPKRAKERQLYVLRRMVENKFISQREFTDAVALPLRIYLDTELNTKYSAYYVEHVRRYLADKYGDKTLYEGGITVSLPISVGLSLMAKKSLQEGLRAVDKRGGFRGPIKHLNSPAEIEEFLKTERINLIEKRIGYRLFLPDGRLDTVAVLNDADLGIESKLLEQDGIYQAVVTRMDAKKKSAAVMIGAIRAELPYEKMNWASNAALSKGDLIWVRVLQINNEQVVVGLEQMPEVQGALVSIDVRTGNLLAMEGGFDYELSEFNRATQALRQPGSAFKPIIYSAAVEKGFTPASIIIDAPKVYSDAESGKWKPANFEEKFYGDTTFRQALIKSRNVPTINIVEAIQVQFLINFAKRLGMTAQFNPDLSISLGSAGASLLELTRVYALFPRLGRKVTPVFINSIRDRDGRVIEEMKPSVFSAPLVIPFLTPSSTPSNAPSSRPAIILPAYPLADDPDQVLDPRVAYVMTHLMKEVITFGTGREAKSLGHISAGKTGTTNDYVDAWFMGFTPDVVTGVWVGYDNQRSIGPLETGAKAALPIWLGFMKEALRSYPDKDFLIPPGVVFATINPTTGKLAASNSSTSIKEAFLEGTEPTQAVSSDKAVGDSQSEFLKEDIE